MVSQPCVCTLHDDKMAVMRETRRNSTRSRKFRVLLYRDEDGAYVAEVPELPGCVSQGATRREALRNVREAIIGYLESLRAHGDRPPRPIAEVEVEIAL